MTVYSVKLKKDEKELSAQSKASDVIFADGIDLQTKFENNRLVDSTALSNINAVSPKVTVIANTDTEYRIKIQSINGTITSPNLKGADSEAVTEEIRRMLSELSARIEELPDFNAMASRITQIEEEVEDNGTRITTLSANMAAQNAILTQADTALSNRIIAQEQETTAMQNRIAAVEDDLDGKLDSEVFTTSMATLQDAYDADKADTANSLDEIRTALNTKAAAADLNRVATQVDTLEVIVSDKVDQATLDVLEMELNAKIESIFHYKGSVADVESLPRQEQEIGDTWNVESTGANYAWNGETWDKLSETIDLSPYAQRSDVYTKQEVDEFLDAIEDQDTTYSAGDGIQISSENQVSVTNRTVESIESEAGTSVIQNTASSAGIRFIDTGGSAERFIGIQNHDDNKYIRIYAKNTATNTGVRLTATPDGIYYTAGQSNDSYTEDDEIITKKDLAFSNIIDDCIIGIAVTNDNLVLTKGDTSVEAVPLYGSISDTEIDTIF